MVRRPTPLPSPLHPIRKYWAALAQEVADAICIAASSALNVSGSAVTNNDGNGNYVQLLSDTIGASSSVNRSGRPEQKMFFCSRQPFHPA